MIFKKKIIQQKDPTIKLSMEHYDFFIENINNHLSIAKQWLGKEKLTYSLEEVAEVERLYLEYFNKKKKNGEWYDEKFEVTVTYFGQTFIKYFFGEWKLNLDKNTFGYGYPLIQKYGPKDGYWVAINIYGWVNSIENKVKSSILPLYNKNLLFYQNSPELNFNPLENLKKNLEKENE